MDSSSLLSSPPITPCLNRSPFHLHFNSIRPSPVTRASSSPPPPLTSSQGTYKGVKPQRDWIGEWVSHNDGFVRILPILVGGLSLVVVLLNRAFSGIAPVADASSSQSRADILTLSLAVTDILTGLVWLSIRPKYISPVVPSGVECKHIKPGIPNDASQELLWFWESLSAATCCKSLVVLFKNDCLLQIGAAAKSSDADGSALPVDMIKLTQGSLYKSCMQSSKQSYLANLSLYPGRTELPFLPNNTQAVILQPIGDKGIAVIGGDSIRGFTATDQAARRQDLRMRSRNHETCYSLSSFYVRTRYLRITSHAQPTHAHYTACATGACALERAAIIEAGCYIIESSFQIEAEVLCDFLHKAWISMVAEKLDGTLSKLYEALAEA